MIKRLFLKNVRTYPELTLEFQKQVYAIIGENGEGKSNLLEAIGLITSGSSFRTERLKELIREGEETAIIEAIVHVDGTDQKIRIEISTESKKILFNSTEYRSYTPILGLIPQVVFSPYDIDLIEGAPDKRRRFLNIQLSQSDTQYARHLTRYSKAVQQKNALLKSASYHLIPYFEEEMEKSGDYLYKQRELLLGRLSVAMQKEMDTLSPKNEQISLIYEPSLAHNFLAVREEEKIRRSCLIGPHRDNFLIMIEGKEGKKFASEGQKRTLISALKFAELADLEARSQKEALLLIDDFGVHLDEERKGLLMKHLKRRSQAFLTTPSLDENLVNSLVTYRVNNHHFK